MDQPLVFGNNTVVLQQQHGLRYRNHYYGKTKRRIAATDNNTQRCGKVPTKRTMTMCTGDDCDRTYYLYLPPVACANNIGTLPLVFAVHCLGCTPATMMHWIEIAEAYHFVLAIPEGLHESFNGQHCCGYALAHEVDDVGFLQAIIQELDQEFPFVSSDLTYALGWSNGGYLVSYAARLFRAIAPISGYEVDVTSNPDRSTAVFLHHAQDDHFVRPTGCCTDSSMPSCCCQLSTYMDTCTSVELKMQEWASSTLNDCRGDSSDGSTALTPRITLEQPGAVTCYMYSKCRANTTYCIHQNKGHFNNPSFQAAFPMANDIADFFARHACQVFGGGQWTMDSDRDQSRCVCPAGATTTMTTSSQTQKYCPPAVVEGNSSSSTGFQSSEFTSPSPSFAAAVEQEGALLQERARGHGLATLSICLLATLSVLFMLYYFYQSSRRRTTYKGFDRVSTVELRSM